VKRREIEQLLPGVYQRTLHEGNPLVALLEVMEALHAPSEAILEQLDSIFDPRRTRDEFLPFLARWVDLNRLFEDAGGAQLSSEQLRDPVTSGLGRLRELIASAAYLSQWRGTKKGLLLFLQTATGASDFEIEEQTPGDDNQPRPFHLLVRAPAETLPHQALIERIIALEKPAYVTYELEFVGPGVR
jgi:phage tail-like protein